MKLESSPNNIWPGIFIILIGLAMNWLADEFIPMGKMFIGLCVLGIFTIAVGILFMADGVMCMAGNKHIVGGE